MIEDGYFIAFLSATGLRMTLISREYRDYLKSCELISP